MRAHVLSSRAEATTHASRKECPRTPSWRRTHAAHVSQFTSLVCNSDPRARTKWYGVYTEEQYNAQRQSEERAKWAAGVRSITGNRDHTAWDGSQLDPPALLSGVTVVIMSPRKPVTVGTVARALGSFECEDLRIVMPRQESYITRHAKSASKGAQYILYRAGHYDSIAEATSDCDVRVAFTRWAQSSSPHVYKVDINGLTSHPAIANVITQPLLRSPPPPPPPSSPWTAAAAAAAEAAEARLGGGSASAASSSGPASGDEEADEEAGSAESRPASSPASLERTEAHASSSSSSSSSSTGGAAPRMPRIALVFGREELGMSDEEVDSCEVCCSVPIGRLQESLSLSHAVSIALCNLYQARLQHLTSSATASSSGGGGPGRDSLGEGGGGGFSGSYLIDPSTGALRVAPSSA
ncbi:hypothetical protein CHLRE_02g081176v5 [Chlamydomonas reinhardtii]|uniref:tRNA/rRNA methyltransferase SpoU type domain-containing protein n=1 Tax=Chlamydomonas reinhardtii TaxID=3055 RepID=A0A2K3E0J8_CHLRE|nr:uncharacterized protein CHLRE_02g081176v5 [Chlamydomonas reinhardtii]PNW86306.1 hypothetical protein CHLRE_02g081176v5 [Chlamydomonas reinhardtii]